MTPDKTPSDSDLQERCAEIVEWQRTGVLPGNALRNYAAKHWAGHTDALQMAERDTSALAMEQIAKWGSPVVAGEPVAWLVRADGEDHHAVVSSKRESADLWIKGQQTMGATYVFTVHPLVTPSQPTQAQAVPAYPPLPEADKVMTPSHSEPYALWGLRKLMDYAKAYHAAQAQAGAVLDLNAAAKMLAERMDYPWEHMPEQGRAEMRKHALAVINAARGIKEGGQHGTDT